MKAGEEEGGEERVCPAPAKVFEVAGLTYRVPFLTKWRSIWSC